MSFEWVRERGIQGKTYIVGVYNQSTGTGERKLSPG